MPLVYKIYERSDDGLLKIPKRWHYGHHEEVFSTSYFGYNTIEEAERAIELAIDNGDVHGTDLIIVMEYQK